MSISLSASIPVHPAEDNSFDLGYTVRRHKHGITIHGSLPVSDYTILLNGWSKEYPDMVVSTVLPERLRVVAVLPFSPADHETWKAGLNGKIDNPDWLLSGDTGVSSKTIWAAFTGQWHILSGGINGGDCPADASDFGRCYRLLKRQPEWATQMVKVAEKCQRFAPLVPIWDELTRLYEEEGNLDEYGRATVNCPKLTQRIRRAQFGR